MNNLIFDLLLKNLDKKSYNIPFKFSFFSKQKKLELQYDFNFFEDYIEINLIFDTNEEKHVCNIIKETIKIDQKESIINSICDLTALLVKNHLNEDCNV